MLVLPLLAQSDTYPTANLERTDVNLYTESYEKVLADVEAGKKEDVKIGVFELVGLPERFVPTWKVSKDGTTYSVRYFDEKTKGAATVHVRTKKFEGRLLQAPSVPMKKVVKGKTVQVWRDQGWDKLSIPFLRGQVRCYMDREAGGETTERRCCEPFTIKMKDGKAIWLWISAEYGSQGMTLEWALRHLKLTK